MKKKWIIVGSVGLVLLGIIFSIIISYNICLGSVKKGSEEVSFNVVSGSSTNQILAQLKSNGLIKSEVFTKVYIKLHDIKGLQAGNYLLNRNMSTKDIIDIIRNGRTINDDISVTFIEGKRITYYANVISKTFNYSYDDVIKTFNDEDYLRELIDKYWFISDDILNTKLYYGLEGYLFPNTYSFAKDASIKDIINVLVYNMGKQLEPYKDDISKSKYSIHELLTLGSIVELEGANSSDRALVAGVFYNRLDDGWTLGSDVTTYYAEQKDFNVELSINEYNACNDYNTRGNCFVGLPVGPICSFSKETIDAVIRPDIRNYYYFVADKNKKSYFATTEYEFNNIINLLKKENLWYTY